MGNGKKKHHSPSFLPQVMTECLQCTDRPCDKWGWFTVGNKTDQTCSPAEGRAPCHMLRYLGTEVQGALGRWRERGANATGQLKSFRRQWNVSWPLGDEWEFAKWGGKIMGPGRDLFQAVGIEGTTFQGSRFWGKFRKSWYMSARGLGGRWKVAGSWRAGETELLL